MNDTEKTKPNYWIVAYNLLIMVVYTVLCRLSAGNAKGEDMWGSGLFLLMLIGIHMITCFVIAGAAGKKEWTLSGILVLIIGFSSCCFAFSI